MRSRALLLLAASATALLLVCTVAVAADDPDYQAQIVGGSAVSNGKYPFVAALLDKRYGSTAFKQQYCGGTLIDQDSVLTAAHCVKGRTLTPLRVTVGRTVLNSDQGKKRRVARIFIHPRYNRNTSARDAAVLKLSRPVSGIAPIKLASAAQNHLESPGRYAKVVGWGNTVKQPVGGPADRNYPNRMREARVPLASDARAKRVYGRRFLPRLMVAAGKESKDTCAGDSGGPMFARASGNITQIGITSWGYGCGARAYPGVYAEVNAFSIRTFITEAAQR
jgi:secreted trypsin-like serine protease